jgi:hypothetical protein
MVMARMSLGQLKSQHHLQLVTYSSGEKAPDSINRATVVLALYLQWQTD